LYYEKMPDRSFLCWHGALGSSATIGKSNQATHGGEDMESVLLDAAGHRRSPSTMPGYHHERAPRNKGLRYPADPPTIEEIVAVMRAAGDGPTAHGCVP
jgi:hypothetical protein